MYRRGHKQSKPRKKDNQKAFYIRRKEKKIKDQIIRDIQILFEAEEEKEEKKHDERWIKDKIIGDIRALFEQT